MKRHPLILALLALLLAIGASLLFGPAGVPPQDLIRGLVDPESRTADLARSLVLDLRMPRTILAALVGGALSLSGVLLQAYFQNPMAGPYVIGVSSGAGLAVAITALISGAPAAGGLLSVPASLAGGLGIVALVSAIAERIRSRRTETLLLIGLAVSAVCSSVTSVLLLLLPRGPEGVLIWLMGSLTTASWPHSIIVAAGLVPALFLALWNTRAFDAILWGDEIARSVGVDVRGLRRLALVAATLPVAAAVSVTGVIGFLGLMVPHVARGLVGPGHARLLPLAIVLGAAWLVAADTIARTLIAPAEIPVGAITSAVGAPFLVWICYRRR